jgi:FixJ family two-component response regulator
MTTRRPHELVLVVVDDDEAVGRALARLLRSCGHEVHVFASAEACLSRPCAADCAILDIHLPGINGLELEERLKQESRGIAVVFMTGRDDSAMRAAVERTNRHLLMKPLDDDGLLAAIASAIGHRV